MVKNWFFYAESELQILDVYPGSRIRLFSIPDPIFFHPGSEFFPSRIHIKEVKYFNLKNCFLSSWKYDPGCSSRIRIPVHPGSGSRTGSRIRIRICNTDLSSADLGSRTLVVAGRERLRSCTAAYGRVCRRSQPLPFPIYWPLG
jgi:hypothetical protein